ncbi:hypothetical protein N7520_006161 [Penicillium odoratum]|uniref:uncharacterized protein n=1 Tax=Penicillium odoratum TaxID=1167516 RepID=UPI0025476EE0|nr:uncharacterized protein N7520_006161 [Penicillium odoratum]KAJ5759005.1 hypothetical protein N7520_006161 [Penicillium odoratum]
MEFQGGDQPTGGPLTSHNEPLESDKTHQPQNKRARRGTGIYPRKRAALACQLCRRRKTKCDNSRPTCGFCNSLGVNCLYGDDSTDLTSYDSASLAIIDRLDRLEKSMNTGFSGIRESQKTPKIADDAQTKDATRIAMQYMVLESILEWPCFSALNLDLKGQSLALKHDLFSQGLSVPSTAESAALITWLQRGEAEDNNFKSETLFLCQSFLTNVHSKNPILNQSDFLNDVDHCMKYGFEENGRSSLVVKCKLIVNANLIACALGAVSRQFSAHDITNPTCNQALSINPLAAIYYREARRILGVLQPSLGTILSLFFCGIFEMFMMKPVNAWFNFQQAAVQLQAYLLGQKATTSEPGDPIGGHLEGRLYWSCMQSECELRAELRIPSSGLEGFNFPYLFPAPPIISEDSDSSQISPLVRQESKNVQIKEWMYYSAETSIRRFQNDIMESLYKHGPNYWLNDVHSATEKIIELENQLELWVSHLPKELRINGSVTTSTVELALHIRTRTLSCQIKIHRPCLYYIIHTPPENREQSAYASRGASLCLDNCVLLLHDVIFHHRHHGTWYVLRNGLEAAFCLLAAVRSQQIPVSDKWHEAVQRAFRFLEMWKHECPNLEISFAILHQAYLDTIYSGKGNELST